MHRLIVLLLLGVPILAGQTTPEVEITAEPHHHLVFENKSVRVFNVEVAPHGDTLMHWHRHDYIFVTLGATEVVNEVEGKPPVRLKLQDGETRFLPAPFAHVARNLAEQPFRNVTIEILQDDKLRSAPWHWDEERGVDILHGGTKEILFVKDSVRVSELELQPGGVVPMHHSKGPQLLVAVSELEISGDAEGHAPRSEHFAAGASKWIPGDYSQAIVNVGKQTAKFVTLEFP